MIREAERTSAAAAVLRFDRGTLLLDVGGAVPPACAPLIAEAAAGLVWDARVCALRAPAHRYAELRAVLRDRSIAVRDRCGVPAAIRVARPPLRDYQASAVDAWRTTRRGIVVLPTGAGKTRVAIAAIASLGLAAAVLVPTRALLWQWQRELRRWYRGPIGTYGDGNHDVQALTVTTFASAYQHLDRFGDRFGLAVVDEVHHFAGGRQTEALEMCIAPARLGLTATLDEGSAAEGSTLARLVGEVVFRLAVNDLAGSFLAPVDHVRLVVQLDQRERAAYDRARAAFTATYKLFRSSGGSVRWSDFVAACQQTGAGRAALHGFQQARQVVAGAAAKRRALEQLLARHAAEPTLVFTAENAAAYAVSRELLIPAVTCDIGKAEREQLFTALREGRINALVSSRVLNEGLDLPEVRVGVILGGTHGQREHVQRVGRLLRPRQGKRALVYELVCGDTYEVRHAEKRQLALAA